MPAKSRKWLLLCAILATIWLAWYLDFPAAQVREHLKSERHRQLVEKYQSLKGHRCQALFAGDSMTAGLRAYMTEGNVNLGLGGETAAGMVRRLDFICDMAPDRIFLMAGINDLLHGDGSERVANRIFSVLDRLTECNEARVYLQSVIPVSAAVSGSGSVNERVMVLNEVLRKGARVHGAVFIDVTTALADSSGALRDALTSDGLHLSKAGYEQWVSRLVSVVPELEAAFTFDSKKLH